MTSPNPTPPAPGPQTADPQASFRSRMDAIRGRPVCVDNHVLVEFALVGLITTLLEVFAGRLHLPQAIDFEVCASYDPGRGNIAALAPFATLPKPHRVHVITDEADLRLIRDLQHTWAARANQPFMKYKNLGEAEGMVLCRRDNWVFLTSDFDALKDAVRLKVPVWHPGWALLLFIEAGKIRDGAAAWRLYRDIVRVHRQREWDLMPLNAVGEKWFLRRAALLTG